MSNYILDGHAAIKEPDLMKWAQWFETGNRVVRKTTFETENNSDIEVSTVFLGIDHSMSYNSSNPILFETMVFGGKLDQEMDRCTTWEEAEKMHAEMLEKVRNSIT